VSSVKNIYKTPPDRPNGNDVMHADWLYAKKDFQSKVAFKLEGVSSKAVKCYTQVEI